ncbi:hypothetical protein SLEP1_g57415 [Rubroshorea leprosula]|uniref:Uncharacterized protein n=1 Tax=Rubroshorea leprosula TaxID=152421 RepID=A0AAV5MLC3_9ROSI|nr:hypothetical protein SLEP1_g57415 [Rubroshorea leprosula]
MARARKELMCRCLRAIFDGCTITSLSLLFSFVCSPFLIIRHCLACNWVRRSVAASNLFGLTNLIFFNFFY